MKTFFSNELIKKMNFSFVLISLIYIEFGHFIFLVLRKEIYGMGVNLGIFHEFSYMQCQFIELNPKLFSLMMLAVYIALLVQKRQDIRNIVNFMLLLNFSMILFGFGLVFKIYQ